MKDTLRHAHFCLGWGRAEWEELFRCSAELEVWPWRSFEMEAVVFEHVPEVRWTRHFCLALIAKAFLHMLKPQFIEFPTQFSSSLDYFKVWGSTEAEGNAKIHQQVQCDSSQLLNRPLYRNDFSVCFWWTDDRFAACQARGASAAEKEQKKQEHEVATTAWNWECFFRHFVGKVAEIQETLGNLKNKAQGAVPHGWSDKRSVSEGFACVSMAKMEGEQRKDMKFSDRISQVQRWTKELAGLNSYGAVEHSRWKTHSDTHTFAWAEVEQNEKSFSGVRLNLKFDLEDHLKWRLLFLNMCLRFDGQGTFAWLWSPKLFFTCWTKFLMNDQMLPSKHRGILEQHGTTVLYVLFLCQVTQKLKGMEDSIRDLNTTVIDSSEGSKHCALCITRSKDV